MDFILEIKDNYTLSGGEGTSAEYKIFPQALT